MHSKWQAKNGENTLISPILVIEIRFEVSKIIGNISNCHINSQAITIPQNGAFLSERHLAMKSYLDIRLCL